MEEAEVEFARALFRALRGGAEPGPQILRRCLVHHVALEHLACPTGLHPTPEERALLGPRNDVHLGPDMKLFQWEIVNDVTGVVHARVLGEYRVEWSATDAEEGERLGGRDELGLSLEVAERRNAQLQALQQAGGHRDRENALRFAAGPRNTVSRGRPGRRRTAA